MYINSDIYKYLRTKPRIGQSSNNDGSKKQSTIQQSTQDIKDLIEAFPSLQNVLTDVDNGLKNLADTNVYLSQGLGKVIGMFTKMDTEIESLIKNITWLEQYNSDLNKSFKINSKSAQILAEGYRKIAIELGRGDKTIFAYADGLQDLTNGFIASSKANDESKRNLLAFQVLAQDQLGLTSEVADGFEKFAAGYGVSAIEAARGMQELTKQLSIETGINSLTLQRDIIQEIGSLSAEARLSFSKMPNHLELAVLKAKALGLSMDQINNIGENLLNIEQSIGNELQYQQVTGRRLLTNENKSFTNEFRTAKVMGDQKRMAELMTDIMEREGDQLRTNFMARKKFVELTGLSTEDVAKALEKQEIAARLKVKELTNLTGKDLDKKIAELRTTYKLEGEDGAAKLADLNKFLEASDTRTTHEKTVEHNLQLIAANIEKVGGTAATREKGGGIDVTKVSNATAGMIKASDNFKNSLHGMASILGKFTVSNEVYTKFAKGLESVTSGLTGAGTAISKFINKINTLKDKFAFSKESADPTTLDTGGSTKNVVKRFDTMIFPERGPAVRLDKADTLYAMRPGDKYDKQLNKSHQQAYTAGMAHGNAVELSKQTFNDQRIITNTYNTTTNNTSDTAIIAALTKLVSNIDNTKQTTLSTNDINTLATAISNAVSNIKVSATIKRDTFLGTTNMNNARMFT